MKREEVELLFMEKDRKVKITFSEWNGKPSVTLWRGSTGNGYTYLLDAINEISKDAKFLGIRINSTTEILITQQTKQNETT